MRELPPLKALLSFAAVADTLNVSKAAEKLCVTQSAVSQQLKVLEDYLDIKLLQRKGKHIALTSEGKQYADKITLAFAAITQATTNLRSETINAHVITVNMHTTFATRWLIPRLIDFQTNYPEYELRISTPIKRPNILTDEIDATIYLGENEWPELSVDFLFRDQLLPVCSPSLLKSRKIARLDLANFTLLHVAAEVRKTDWPIWLKAANRPALNHYRVIKFPTLDQALEAAAAGLGIAMGSASLIASEIKKGNLITPYALQVPEPHAYHLIYPKQPNLKHYILRDWLMAQINNSPPLLQRTK